MFFNLYSGIGCPRAPYQERDMPHSGLTPRIEVNQIESEVKTVLKDGEGDDSCRDLVLNKEKHEIVKKISLSNISEIKPSKTEKLLEDFFMDQQTPLKNAQRYRRISTSNSSNITYISRNSSYNYFNSPLDTPVGSVRIFTQEIIKTKSQCNLCREAASLVNCKINCTHIPINDDENTIFF